MEIFSIVITIFQIEDKVKRSQYFKEIILLDDINIIVVLDIFFLILSNKKMNFGDQKLNLKLYITVEIFSITKQMKLFEKKEFIVVTLDWNDETFII